MEAITTVGLPQHMTALAEANRVRLHRARLKREIAEGERPVWTVLDDPDFATMRVEDLLCVQHRWGHQRARRFLNSVALRDKKGFGYIGPEKTCGALTERQLRPLVEALKEIG